MTINNYSYQATYFPRDPIEFPPVLPIPGKLTRQSGTSNASKHIWPFHPLPSYMGETFPVLSQFWVIVQEIEIIYNLKDSRPLVERVPPAFAESKYQKLLAWADTLSPDMELGEHSFSHVFVLQ